MSDDHSYKALKARRDAELNNKEPLPNQLVGRIEMVMGLHAVGYFCKCKRYETLYEIDTLNELVEVKRLKHSKKCSGIVKARSVLGMD